MRQRIESERLPQGVQVLKIGVPGGNDANEWITGGTRILLRESGLTRFKLEPSAPNVDSSYLLDRIGMGLDPERVNEAAFMLQVIQAPTVRILRRVLSGDYLAAVADVAQVRDSDKPIREAAILSLPGLDWGDTVAASLVVNESVRPKVLQARNFVGISDIPDRVIVRMLVSSDQARAKVRESRYDRVVNPNDIDYFNVYN